MSEQQQSNLNSSRGRWTVVGMFSFAGMMVMLLFVYWELYTAPFRELQYAIADAYPGSGPRVIGGQHKSHKTIHPKTLRVIIYVSEDEFDPESETEKSETRSRELARLAFEHHNVQDYAELEIILLRKIPEAGMRRWSTTKTVEEWKAVLQE